MLLLISELTVNSFVSFTVKKLKQKGHCFHSELLILSCHRVYSSAHVLFLRQMSWASQRFCSDTRFSLKNGSDKIPINLSRVDRVSSAACMPDTLGFVWVLFEFFTASFTWNVGFGCSLKSLFNIFRFYNQTFLVLALKMRKLIKYFKSQELFKTQTKQILPSELN